MNDLILRTVARFQSEEGQSLAEYGLILGLIAVVCIAALTALASIIVTKFDLINVALGG